MAKKISRRFDRLVIWPLCWLSLGALVFFYFKGFEAAMTAPLSLGGEGPSLYAAYMLSQNLNPYDTLALSEHPWRVVASPPVYFATTGWLLKLSGPSLIPLRVVSAAGFVIFLVAAHRVFALSGASRLGRLLGLINLGAFWSIWAYAFRATPDMLALALMVMAIEQYMVLARKPKDDNIFRFPRLIVIATLAVLASLARGSCAAVVPAIALALIVGRQWRLSLVFMLLSSVLAFASMLLLNNITAGGLAAHLAFSESSPFSFHALHEHLTWLSSDWLILAAAPVCIINLLVGYINGYEEREGPYRHHLAALVVMVTLFFLSSAVSLYVMGKAAAGVADFFLILFAVAWMVAVSAEHLNRRYLLLMFLAFGCGFFVISSLHVNQNKQIAVMKQGLDEIKERNLNGDLMLCEESSLPQLLDLTPEFVDLPTMKAVWERNPQVYAARMAEIKERIARKGYGSIVINSQDGCLIKPYQYWDEAVVRLIKANYKSVAEIAVDGRMQDFYLPRK